MADTKDETRALRYEDRPDLFEAFVDSVQRMTFDGRTLRIEFCVNRWDDPSPAGRSGRSIPISRLVLDLEGAVDLFNKINSLQAALENVGVIRKELQAPAAAPAAPAPAAPAPAAPAEQTEAAKASSKKK